MFLIQKRAAAMPLFFVCGTSPGKPPAISLKCIVPYQYPILSSAPNINQKRQFMQHRATEQLRNQIVTATSEVAKMVSDFF